MTLSSMGGSAGVELALVDVERGFSEVLAELVERSRHEPKPLTALLAAAELTRLEEPGVAAKTEAVRPWLHLLQVVGAGIALTPAGWLPPALVHQIATDLDLLEPRMGKGSREQNFRPVRELRETATDLGLLRKRKGELLPTALGTRLAGDPEGMWRHVAEARPLGRKPLEWHAGAINAARRRGRRDAVRRDLMAASAPPCSDRPAGPTRMASRPTSRPPSTTPGRPGPS